MLEIIKNKGLIFDIEIFKNAFIVTVFSLRVNRCKTFTWFEDINQVEDLINLVCNKDDPRIWIGYNSIQFDQGVIDHLIYNWGKISILKLWEFSQTIINQDKNPYRYNSHFSNSLDLMEVIREGYTKKSLKGIAVNLKFPKIQDLPFHYTSYLTKEDVQKVIDYNKNDVDITLALLNHLEIRLEMRQVISEQYNLNVLSAADSYIAKELFNKFYYEAALKKNPDLDIKQLKYLRTKRDNINISDLVLPGIKFQTKELNSFFQHIKTLTIVRKDDDSYTCDIPELKYAGMTYTVALGGIHSVDEPLIIETPENELLLDIDISSQYPTAIINNRTTPAHLDPDIFIPLVKDIVEKRLWYKKHKKENSLYGVLEKGLKITINTIDIGGSKQKCLDENRVNC